MKMWYNTDDDTGVEVDFVTGALSLLSSLTGYLQAPPTVAFEHASQILTFQISMPGVAS
jgi:hypothetical protein